MTLLAMSVLIPAKLDGQLSYSWAVVMIPIWLFLVFAWIALVMITLVNTYQDYWLYDNVVQAEWDGLLTVLSREIVRTGAANNVLAIAVAASVTMFPVQSHSHSHSHSH